MGCLSPTINISRPESQDVFLPNQTHKSNLQWGFHQNKPPIDSPLSALVAPCATVSVHEESAWLWHTAVDGVAVWCCSNHADDEGRPRKLQRRRNERFASVSSATIRVHSLHKFRRRSCGAELYMRRARGASGGLSLARPSRAWHALVMLTIDAVRPTASASRAVCLTRATSR